MHIAHLGKSTTAKSQKECVSPAPRQRRQHTVSEVEERSPQCSACRRPVRIFQSDGMTSDEKPFVTPMPIPCAYCAETNRLRGWKELIGYLLEAREG